MDSGKSLDYSQAHASRGARLYFPLISVSDPHLLNKFATAELLLEFLMNVETDTLVLNGDIIDGWYRMSRPHSKVPEIHARVIDCILSKAASGTKVVYVAGNHDDCLRGQPDLASLSEKFGLEITAEEYETTDPWGRKILFLHGDRFDPPMPDALYRIGDFGYETLVATNALASQILPYHLRPHFSLAAAAKKGAKWLVNVVGSFEDRVIEHASRRDADVVFCGHIHTPAVRPFRRMDGRDSLYVNSGDWVEGCTAAVLTPEGDFRTVFWYRERLVRGLIREPRKADPNPFASFRPLTEDLFRFFNGICLPRDVRRLMRESAEHSDKAFRYEMMADAFEQGAHGIEGIESRLMSDVVSGLVEEMREKSGRHARKCEKANQALAEKMSMVANTPPVEP
jgi:UDP-2,3-diacylglucosamine pyrophosphatase LpxH